MPRTIEELAALGLKPYGYFRDHEYGWGVRDSRDDKVLATGLDKGQAYVVAMTLNGELRDACGLLTSIASHYPDGMGPMAISVPAKPA